MGKYSSDYNPLKKSVKYPCRNCIHFKVCGDYMRERSCKGRKTAASFRRKHAEGVE